MALIVSVSGVRGIVGNELTPDVVMRYAAAFGSTLLGGKVAVGRDSRPSGASLKDAVVAGLTSVGCSVVELGILPTPTCGFLVRELGCQAGIQITASHNPSPYNGLKLFGADGAVLTATAGAAIQSLYLKSESYVKQDSMRGAVEVKSSAGIAHLDRVRASIERKAISAVGFRIVLDANGGAGGPMGLEFLKSLGCTVFPVGCEPDGDFRHNPEPLPAHLGDIEKIVRANPRALGAAFDPDADRLVLIDESGQCLSEELTLALAVQQRLAKDRGPVVINLSTSRTTEDVAKAADVACYRSAVGEANVVQKMREVGAIVGGEGGGGVIDPRVGWVRDPFIGLGLILERMAQTGKTLKQLAGDLPRYLIRKEKLKVVAKALPNAFATLKSTWADIQPDETDGLRFAWRDRWVHIRASNTEPIVRIIAEASNADALERLCQQAKQALTSE